MTCFVKYYQPEWLLLAAIAVKTSMTQLHDARKYFPIFLGVISLLVVSIIIMIALQSALAVFGLLIAIAALIITLIYPDWLFVYVYPLLIMTGQVPITIAGASVSLERVLVIAGSVGVVGAIGITKRISLHVVPKSVAWGVCLWLGFYIIAWVVSPSDMGVVIVLGYIQKVIMAYIVYISLSNINQFLAVSRSFLLASFIASLVAIIVFWQQGSLQFIREGSYVAYETIDESLIPGLARAGTGNTMAIWIAIMFLWQASSKKKRVFWTLAVLWFGIIGLFALRRETLITIPVGLLIIIWKQPSRRFQTGFLNLALVILIGLFVTLSPEWVNRLTNETVSDFSSGEDMRTSLLVHFTPAAWMASPVFGYGPGNYGITQFRFPDTVPPVALLGQGIAAHNSWSATVVEAGGISLIGLFLFLYGIGRAIWRIPRNSNEHVNFLGSISPVIYVQLLLSMFFGNAISLPYIWFWLGFLMAFARIARKSDERQMITLHLVRININM